MSDESDIRSRIRDFMVSRRARISPGDVGIPTHGRTRRVPGLRRDEVAMLAGVSVEYYTRLERGDAAGASDSVIDAVARVLRLNDVEREHLRRLHLALTSRVEPVKMVAAVRPEVQRLLDALESVPAYAINHRGDVIASNTMGRAFYAPMYDAPEARTPMNTTWYLFASQASSRAFWVDWDVIADNCVANLRTDLGSGAEDPELEELVSSLLQFPEFATRWASHDVRRHATGVKRFDHPVVGRMDLTYESMAVVADPDVSLLTYSAEPSSPSDDAMRLLGIWARDGERAALAGGETAAS